MCYGQVHEMKDRTVLVLFDLFHEKQTTYFCWTEIKIPCSSCCVALPASVVASPLQAQEDGEALMKASRSRIKALLEVDGFCEAISFQNFLMSCDGNFTVYLASAID